MWIQILFTALLASVFSFIAVYVLFVTVIKKEIMAIVGPAGDEVQSKVKQGVMDGIDEEIEKHREEIGSVIESRVKQGILEGVKAIPSADVLQGTTKAMAQTGLDLVEDGLSAGDRIHDTTKAIAKTGLDILEEGLGNLIKKK